MGNSVYGVNPQTGPACANFGDTPSASPIYDRSGNRKYLTAEERRRFLRVVAKMPPDLRTTFRPKFVYKIRTTEVVRTS